MSRGRLLLIVSLALNLCLFASGLVRSSSVRPRAQACPPAADRAVFDSPAAQMQAPPATFNWRQIESDDYRVYAASLRAIGCPEETVQDIILAEVNKLYAPRFAAILAPVETRGYWQRPRAISTEAMTRRRALLDEKNATIKALLGLTPDQVDHKDAAGIDSADQRLGFLPETKRRPVRDLEDKNWELEQRIYAAAKGVMTAEDRAALQALQHQKADEMNALLTPNERLDYDLRNSQTARTLQQTLGPFDPSEQEFRAIYQAQSALDDKLASLRTSDGGQTRDHADTQAHEDFENQIKWALGEQRYLEYRRAQNPAYQNLVRIADRFQLPREVAGQVFDFRQNTELESSTIATNPLWSEEQKRASLQDLRQQANSTISSLLGQKGFSVYRDQSGEWIDALGNH